MKNELKFIEESFFSIGKAGYLQMELLKKEKIKTNCIYYRLKNYLKNKDIKELKEINSYFQFTDKNFKGIYFYL